MTNNLDFTDKKKPRLGRILGIAALVVVLLGCAAVAYEWHQSSNFKMPAKNSSKGNNNSGSTTPQVLPILISGIDQRGSEPSRTDTLMVAFIDRTNHTAKVLAIPRDTRTSIPNHTGQHKINAANAYGGPQAAVETVNNLLGTDIYYYMQTNFVGFQAIVDSLGGVTLNIDQTITSGNVTLSPGVQRLNGKQALVYVRNRKYPQADIDRIKHQQLFIKAVAKEALQAHNLTKIPALVKGFNSTVKSNFSNMQMLQLANELKGVQSIEYYTLPGHGQYIDGISYWVADSGQLTQLVASLQAGQTPQGTQMSQK